MKLTCIVPCYERPERTIRSLESIISQEFNEEWEALFIGDGCYYFQKYIDDGTFDKYSKFPVKFINLEKNYGGWGTMARKTGIDLAKGKYIIFLDNDDVLLNSHFENYYRFMYNNPDIDMGYFNTYVEPWQNKRDSYLGPCGIGHAELIIKSEILKKEYEIDYEYEHDWRLINKLINKGYTHLKCKNSPTYIIKGIPSSREIEID